MLWAIAMIGWAIIMGFAVIGAFGLLALLLYIREEYGR